MTAESYNKWERRVIPLAGALQALDAVDQLATTGFLQRENFETALWSLFQQQPESTLAVFSKNLSTHPLRTGLQHFISLYESPTDARHHLLLKYAIGILSLQKKVARRNDLQYIIRSQIENLKTDYPDNALYNDHFIQQLANVYVTGLKPYKGFITVQGNSQYLQQEHVAQQIRILLLAAIRAVWVWRQCGGKVWQLVVHRSLLQRTAESLLCQ